MEKSLNELINDTKKSLSQKNYDDALKNLYLIIKKDTNNLSALSTIGDIKVFQRKYIDAIQVFDSQLYTNNLEKAYCEALDRFIDEKKLENIYI